MNFVNYLKGKKTYITAVVTILFGLVVVGWGQHNWIAGLSLILGGSGLGSFRAAISKVEKALTIANDVLTVINSANATTQNNTTASGVNPSV